MKSGLGIFSVKRQRGTVLLMALLIVAVITGIAISFTGSFQLSLARAEQRFYTSQMKQYWLSIENFALWGLKEDLEQDVQDHGQANDHLQELWSTSDVLVPLEAGTASAVLEDAQSRFNLNQLGGRVQPYDPNGTFAQRFNESQQRFVRLLQTYPDVIIDTSEAEQITEAVMDWVDGDNDVTGIGGAEEGYYLGLDPAYRAANQLFASVSELRLVKGISKELYEYLLPLVVAIPNTSAGININTAKVELLRTLGAAEINTPLSESDGQSLRQLFPVDGKADPETATEDVPLPVTPVEEGFNSVQEFVDSDAITTLFGSDPDDLPLVSQLSTGSQYFLLSVEVQIAEAKRRGYSLVKRESSKGNNTASIVKRGTDANL